MPLPVPPGGPGQNAPVVGAGGAPGQPPLGGAGGASMPSPNRGAQAGALAKVGVVIKILERLIPEVGIADELGKDVVKALNILGKHVPPGAQNQGVEHQALQDLMMKQKQENPMLQMMKMQGQGGPGLGAGGVPPTPPPTM